MTTNVPGCMCTGGRRPKRFRRTLRRKKKGRRTKTRKRSTTDLYSLIDSLIILLSEG